MRFVHREHFIYNVRLLFDIKEIGTLHCLQPPSNQLAITLEEPPSPHRKGVYFGGGRRQPSTLSKKGWLRHYTVTARIFEDPELTS